MHNRFAGCRCDAASFVDFVLPCITVVPSLAVLLFLLNALATAQGAGQGPTGRPIGLDETISATHGQVMDDYTVQQLVEFGGRITNLSGSEAVYGALVNEQSGLRLFQQSLLVQPVRGGNGLLDNLYFESFGWGGDPCNAARLRASRRRVFDLSASFRRDQNYFNYDLLADPLNPASTNSLPTITVNDSPHRMYLRRRMYDFNLTLLPQRKFSFFVGYSRDRNAGPSFSSVHVGIHHPLGLHSFIPYRTDWGCSVWIEIDRERVGLPSSPVPNYSPSGNSTVRMIITSCPRSRRRT